MSIQINLQRDQLIIDLYNQGFNCKQVAKQLNISSSTCERALKRNNITINKYKNRRFINHNLKENYFSILNVENIYYLGFIFADGNIYKPSGNHSFKLTIDISSKDIEILENFHINNKINYTNKNSVYMCIISNKICEDLINLGVTPNKTHTCLFPDIPQELISHFIRGYFDGDGCFHINKYNKLIATICGNKNFLEKLGSYLPCKYSIRDTKKGIFELRISTIKEEMNKFVNYIYKDAHFFLKRKYNKTLNFN